MAENIKHLCKDPWYMQKHQQRPQPKEYRRSHAGEPRTAGIDHSRSQGSTFITGVTNLVTNLTAPSDEINSDAQRYLYRVLLYQMNPKERDELTGANVPPASNDPSRLEALLSKLADGVDNDLKRCLHTFTRA